MLDDYMLEIYGIEQDANKLIGQFISFPYYDGEKEVYLLKDYKISGIFAGEVLSKRENTETSDLHIEHMYVNLRDEDMKNFQILYGSIRCYQKDYKNFVKKYNYMDSLLKYNLEEVFSEENEILLTQKGMTYSMIHFFMDHVGKLLVIISGVIIFIIVFSVTYIFKFYMDRQKKYRKMLAYIGMGRRERCILAGIEIFLMLLVAFVIGVYCSTMFLMLLNKFTSIVFEFPIIFFSP